MPKRQLRSALHIRGEAANSNSRASELRRLAASRIVMAILKKHIWVAEDLETYLEDMGYSVDENGEVLEKPRSEVRSRAMRARMGDGDATRGSGS